jgi:hypothetical protein
MADTLGLIISPCDASEKLYRFYQAAQRRDKDVADLRLQLLGLQEKAVLVRVALEREGLRTEDQHKVIQALQGCENEVGRIQEGLTKFPQKTSVKGKTPTRAKLWFQGLSQKAQWPFQRSTIVNFLEDVRTCHSVVDESLKLLQLKVGVRTIEELRALDDKLTNNLITSEAAFRDLRSGIESAFERITEELAKQRQQQVQQRKVVLDRITVEEIDKLLPDPDFQKRRSEVSESHDGTYDLFAKDVQEYPQAANLLSFLQTGTGAFWISGEAASGKIHAHETSFSSQTVRRSASVGVGGRQRHHDSSPLLLDSRIRQPEVAVCIVASVIVLHPERRNVPVQSCPRSRTPERGDLFRMENSRPLVLPLRGGQKE